MAEQKQGKYTLEVPLDASGVEDFKPDQKVKVLVVGSDGGTQSVAVDLDAKGKGTARLDFDAKPGALRVIIGPPDADDEELQGLQTISVSVSARRWADSHRLALPVVIAPYYWWWWKRWCRKFVIRGRLLCPDGRPVPGAKVCAYDVDAWWWWSSRQLVGCGTTDATGAFQIVFRWCCGWWPWWWWQRRLWQLEPYLIDRIVPVLQREPHLRRIPLPDPAPDLRIFEELLGKDEIAALNLLRPQPQPPIPVGAMATRAAAPESATLPGRVALQPNLITRLRDKIVARLPVLPELEQLRIWPWWPGHPWWDCTPDIIFRATQDCGQPGAVVLEEGYGDARWNIDPITNVTLEANDSACCVADGDDDPQGICALITDVCDSPINAIGGNPGAPAAPVGYLSPSAALLPENVTNDTDRPYGERVLIQGQVGAAVDYYEFEVSADDGATWSALPVTAIGDIPRQYWIPASNTFVWVPFLDTIDGRRVFESRPHYEATHDPATWGITRFWMAHNYMALMNWLTHAPFLNGTYRLRMLGWQLVGGHLATRPQVTPPPVLPTCSTQTPAGLVLRIDNRLVGAGSGHPPSVPSHPCGSGTVHSCTLEPDTDFLGVRIIRPNGTKVEVAACGNVPIGEHDILQVDFFAHDPDGHLAYYTLQATYGENLARDLLAQPSLSLAPLGAAPVPPAVQVGPTYAAARLAGAAAPNWSGGAIRLEVKAKEAFPVTCCYQLELRAHKRTIIGCNHTLWNHINYSEHSFMIVVAPEPEPV